MIDEQVSKIVANAMTKLSPTLLKAVADGKYFVTAVNDQVMKEGIITLETFVMIDCEKQVTFDAQEFYAHSMYLYNQFKNIPKWYEC